MLETPARLSPLGLIVWIGRMQMLSTSLVADAGSIEQAPDPGEAVGGQALAGASDQLQRPASWGRSLRAQGRWFLVQLVEDALELLRGKKPTYGRASDRARRCLPPRSLSASCRAYRDRAAP